MSDLIDRLSAEAKILQSIAKERDLKNVAEPLDRLRDAANEVGRSWSGSWLGYQSRVYYANLQPTPAGAHFSSEWGFQDLSLGLDVGGTRGDWHEYTFESVREGIFSRAGIKSLTKAEQLSARARSAFETARELFLSVLTVSLSNKDDSFLYRLKEQVDKMKIGSKFDYARALQPSGKFFTRDTLALTQGFQTPPHLAILGEVTALLEAPKKCGDLVASRISSATRRTTL